MRPILRHVTLIVATLITLASIAAPAQGSVAPVQSEILEVPDWEYFQTPASSHN